MEPKKISEYTWKIEKQGNMLVPAIIFASDALMKKIKEDRTLQQAANVATLPGIIKQGFYIYQYSPIPPWQGCLRALPRWATLS